MSTRWDFSNKIYVPLYNGIFHIFVKFHETIVPKKIPSFNLKIISGLLVQKRKFKKRLALRADLFYLEGVRSTFLCIMGFFTFSRNLAELWGGVNFAIQRFFLHQKFWFDVVNQLLSGLGQIPKWPDYPPPLL